MNIISLRYVAEDIKAIKMSVIVSRILWVKKDLAHLDNDRIHLDICFKHTLFLTA